MAGLKKINYQKRIDEALKRLDGGALLVFSQPKAIRNSDVHHRYRQHSFLYYLTGFEEPNSVLLIRGQEKKTQDRVILFLQEKDALAELWDGRRLGVEDAKKTLDIDNAQPIKQLWQELPELLKDNDKLFYQLGEDQERDRNIVQFLIAQKRKRGRTAKSSLLPVFDSAEISGPMRLIKSSEEVERMRAAALASKKTFDKVFAEVKPGMNERDVHAMLLGGFMANGSEAEAYGSIVAGGANACCLHYTTNNAELKNGDLLLIDAGAQLDYYASDVTRTFPIGKKFSPEQKAIYEIVLESQLKALEKCKPGETLVNIHETALLVMIEGLIKLGLLKGNAKTILEKKGYMSFCPHGTSHWLGMDVHDVGDYAKNGKPMPLAEGMCFTVEPGLYIDPNNNDVPKKFRGIGVRIEDDILITSKGHENLTKGIPKAVKDLENRY